MFFELRFFNGEKCFRVETFGSKKDALKRFHKTVTNTKHARDLLIAAGQSPEVIANSIQLVQRNDSMTMLNSVECWEV